MAGKSSKNNNRGSDLFGYFVSGKDKQYHTNEFAGSSDASGLIATGGIISDYTSGSDVYRAHIFTSSGTFDVTEIGNLGANVEYLVVAGAGGGGGRSGGGGGAGGLRTNLSGHPLAGSSYSVSTTNPYTVIVGGGGNGGWGDPGGNSQAGTSGGLSEFYPTPGGTGSGIKSNGGGGGAGCNGGTDASTGGSGGGGGAGNPNSKAAGNTPITSPSQGNTGGASGGTFTGGGGGGAGGPGVNATGSAPGDKAGNGGLGVRVAIAGPSSDPSPIGATGPGSGASATGWFAGGGGGGNYSGGNAPVVIGYGGAGPSGTAPYAGAGNGSKTTPVVGDNGTFSTGGGGGGGGLTSPAPDGGSSGGNGGSGTVVIRYQIGTVNTSNAKASGGAISFYGTKTIHVFTGSGEFIAPGSFNETLEYVIVGGGGAGGGQNFRGGGGGAGAVRHGTTPIDNTGPGNPSTTTVQVGAGGVYVAPEGPNGNGTSSFFGSPITSPGGGMGGGYNPPYAGIAGGSGGGAGGRPGGSDGAAGTDPGPATGDNYPGDPADTSPANGWGYRGGGRGDDGLQQGGGGGGAGGQGIPSDKSSYPGTYGYGGPGIQLPATFRDPRSAPGGTGGTGPHGPGVGGGLGYQSPGGTDWYVAGGGNGGGYSKPTGVNPSVITFVPAGGGGRGAINGPGNSGESEHPYRNNGWPGAVNSGSGGGGASPAYEQDPGQGGSGLVLIAYPTG